MNSVLILGGYGNFGKRIAAALVRKHIPVIIAGRNETKAQKLVSELGELASIAVFDIHTDLAQQLEALKPTVVIHTCGPFQGSDYHVAKTCIEQGVHYIDLSDGRDFVVNIAALNEKAKEAGVSVISGASTVPALSSAVLEHFKDEFAEISHLRFGISPGQKAERGLATTQGILSYVGKPLKPFAGNDRAYGWQNIYRQPYPELGNRWMANCDIPDLDLLPAHYGIKRIQFSAGLELGLLHSGLWGVSWLVRLGLPLHLPRHAKPLLTISNWFNRLGSADGGMHMIISGTDHNSNAHKRSWFIIAKDGDGPHIPTIPAIILAEKLSLGEKLETGAYACVGKVGLDEYLSELKPYPIITYQR